MTTFAQLFPQGPRTEDASPTYDDHHTVRRLTEMIGDPRDELDMTTPRSSAHRLTQLVAEAQASPSPAAAWAPPAKARKRPRRRIDVFSMATAALAVVALATAGVVAGVQMASADPAGNAMLSLRADEESIQSAESAVGASHERLTGWLATTATDAATLRAAVEAARVVPHPDAERSDETVEILDAAKADEIIAEIDRYTAEVQAVTVPDLPTPYARPDLDENSLADVGEAIGLAQKQLTVLDEATGALRDSKSVFDAIEVQHFANLEVLAAGFVESGAALIEDNPDADAELQDAVTAAAASVAASKLLGADGAAAVTVYRDAVLALIIDQRGADAEREREEQRRRDQGPAEPTPTDPPAEPTEPPAEPTDPVGVIPPVEGESTP